MSSIVQIDSVAITNVAHQTRVPTGKYSAFVFKFEGTNAAADAITEARLGTIQLTENARQRQFIHFDRLGMVNDLKYGTLERAPAAATQDFTLVYILPQYDPAFHQLSRDKNIIDVDELDNIFLQWQGLAAVGPSVLNGTLTTYGIIENSNEKYCLKLEDYDIQSAGAGIIKQNLTAFENVNEVFLEDDAVLTRLRVFKDGKEYIDADNDILESMTQAHNKIELAAWAAPAFLDLRLVETGEMDSGDVFAEDVNIVLEVTGAATIKAVISSIDYSGQRKLLRSAALRTSDIERRSTKKMTLGHSRAISTVKNIQAIRPSYASNY